MHIFSRDSRDIIDIELDYKSLSKSAIPLLIEDEMWLKLFSNIKEKEMIKLREKLTVLVVASREVRDALPIKKEEKRKLITKILTLSEKVNNNEMVEGIELLEEYKVSLNEVNDDIEELTFKSETLPSDVRSLNLDLLIETIKYAYLEIRESEENLGEIEAELNELRSRLREIIQEKYDNEDKKNEIYKFLHNVLGANEVDKLDRDILE